MCLIVDANVAGDLFGSNPPPAMRLLMDWVFFGKGQVATGGKNLAELSRSAVVVRAFTALRRAGRLATIDCGSDDGTDAATLAVDAVCKSDDPHVLILAMKSGSRFLCTLDQPLQSDFRDKALINTPRGMVYPLTGQQKALTAALRRGHTPGCPKP